MQKADFEEFYSGCDVSKWFQLYGRNILCSESLIKGKAMFEFTARKFDFRSVSANKMHQLVKTVLVYCNLFKWKMVFHGCKFKRRNIVLSFMNDSLHINTNGSYRDTETNAILNKEEIARKKKDAKRDCKL